MEENVKEKSGGPFHKLKSSFKEIFGKSDLPTFKTEPPAEKPAVTEQENIRM